MFQRILVPLDGSTRAESALPVAARLAKASGGSVILLHVLQRSASPDFFSSSVRNVYFFYASERFFSAVDG
jgi:nucleotide-binding universal stress UspA family protein